MKNSFWVNSLLILIIINFILKIIRGVFVEKKEKIYIEYKKIMDEQDRQLKKIDKFEAYIKKFLDEQEEEEDGI